MFRNAVIGEFTEECELVALCVTNEGRLQLSRNEVHEQTGQELPGYFAEEFERMLLETRPDCVIVTTKESTHDAYICRAMELGCDVITEKPMTIDVELDYKKGVTSPLIQIELLPIKTKVRFGSYNLIKAKVKNSNNYYVATELIISRTN